jgi:hypothetical protein
MKITVMTTRTSITIEVFVVSRYGEPMGDLDAELFLTCQTIRYVNFINSFLVELVPAGLLSSGRMRRILICLELSLDLSKSN